MGIFSKQEQPTNNVKRNAFDLSHDVHGTYSFGTLYPVFCREVINKSTFEIDPSFGLQFMPTAFPVQSKIDAKIDFFYVRNRTLYKDWMNFQFDTKPNLVSPYLDLTPAQSRDFFKVGGIADHMGVPVVIYGAYGRHVFQPPYVDDTRYPVFDVSEPLGYESNLWKSYQVLPFQGNPFLLTRMSGEEPPLTQLNRFYWHNLPNTSKLLPLSDFYDSTFNTLNIYVTRDGSPVSNQASFEKADVFDSPTQGYFGCSFSGSDLPAGERILLEFHIDPNFFNQNYPDFDNSTVFNKLLETTSLTVLSRDKSTLNTYSIDNSFIADLKVNTVSDNSYGRVVTAVITIPEDVNSSFNYIFAFPVYLGTWHMQSAVSATSDFYPQLCSISYYSSLLDSTKEYIEISENPDYNPYIKDSDGKIPQKLSALPFRAYEMIYNSFYRDMRNNPYYPNGPSEEPEYDQYLPSVEGGADSNDYKLRSHNWEQDFLTTCQFSPQYGTAPLVGISSSGTMTFRDENGDDYDVQATWSDDGQLENVSYRQNLPNSVARSLVNVATSGISINDFRNVNAYQRWLEMHLRRGLKYRDLVKAEWDVDLAYNVVDMPEFIGGVKVTVNASKVNQTSEGTADSPLGSFAGQLSCIASAKHKVKCFCDEAGFVIGILTIRPTPSYSQLLPKHFTKFDTLDYYNYEFRHLGMQPVRYNEVCPLQAYNDPSGSALPDIFGYQRSWYDYVSSVDTVHGLMRTQLRNFLINRVFDEKPVLSPDFLTMSDKHLNDVFTVTESTDKIIGKIHFDVKAVLPIPRYVIPQLE